MLSKKTYNADELLELIAQGNELAFRHLFETYHNKLYNYILKITGSKETAEDTVHDVFLKIWIQKEKLPGIQNLDGYLFRMCYNHAINGFRRMATETLVMATLQKKPEKANLTPEDQLLNKEIRKLIHRAVDTLTPQQKEVFKLSREVGLKQQEIASQLNISIFTVKKHLTNALNHVRKEISQHYGPHAIPLFVLSWYLL